MHKFTAFNNTKKSDLTFMRNMNSTLTTGRKIPPTDCSGDLNTKLY